MKEYDKRCKALDAHFRQGKDCRIEDTAIDIRFFRFKSMYNQPRSMDPAKTSESGTRDNISVNHVSASLEEEQVSSAKENNELLVDHQISENFSFEYPVFLPAGVRRFESCILLLHGLNERNWNKYLPWAEFLCFHTGKPVILFPIAYHINRAPLSWSNPRSLTGMLNFRRDAYEGDRSISYANIALSDRISQRPERFYLSGRQTWDDLTVLLEEIKTGCHPLFKEDANIDIFAYSIGAFLSQVALMANRKGLFSDSRLFMFCGGSIFRSMQGISRSIMDRPAFEQLQHYYVHVFGNEEAEPHPLWKRDKAFQSFFQMIMPQRLRVHRENFFAGIADRVRGIALAKDSVIPYHGIEEAMGEKTTRKNIQLLDYPFQYSHETPFPINTKQPCQVNTAFTHLISKAADFLG